MFHVLSSFWHILANKTKFLMGWWDQGLKPVFEALDPQPSGKNMQKKRFPPGDGATNLKEDLKIFFSVDGLDLIISNPKILYTIYK